MKLCVHCGRRFHSEDWRCPVCHRLPKTLDGFISFAPESKESREGFGAGFFEDLYRLEGSSFWFRSRNRLLGWGLKRYFPGAGNFLEIGCGTGFVLSHLGRIAPRLRLSGSDMFFEGLSFSRKRLPGVTLFQMDARHIPFDQEFDVIGAFDVLEHIGEDEDVLKQMYRAVKPGGGIMLTVPQHRFLWSRIDERSFHKRRYVKKI